MVGLYFIAAFLMWLGAMSMTFASTFAGLVMALLGLGILLLALRMGGFFGHSRLV